MRPSFRHVTTTAISLAFLATASPVWAADELNALVWCDHADPNLLQPFEEANDVRVNVKEYEGTGAGLAIVEQSQPGDWDVMVIDSVDVPRVAGQVLFAALPEDQLPFADLFAEVVLDDFTKQDGKRYAITEKFRSAARRAVQRQDRDLRLLSPRDGHGGVVSRQDHW